MPFVDYIVVVVLASIPSFGGLYSEYPANVLLLGRFTRQYLGIT